MRVRRFVLLTGALALLAFDSGCVFRRWRERDRERYTDYYRNDPYYGRRGDYGAPPNFPANGPYSPPIGSPGPMGVPPGAGTELLTPQPPPRDFAPPNQSGYAPLPNGVRPAEHLAIPGRPRAAEPPLARATPLPPRVRLLPPDLLDPPAGSAATNIPPGPHADTSPSLPVGVVGFAEPKDKLATGRKPETEGLDWLQSNGYKTVIHLRRPGTDDSADREQIVKRGMKYLSFEITGATLTKDVLDQFNSALADTAALPLFVYDKDGTLAGAMWYLHFRTADGKPDGVARSKAEGYGLRLDGDDEVIKLWAAIQLLVAEKPGFP